jgi:hypothetical protein
LLRLRDAIDACAAIEEFVAGVSDDAVDFKQNLFVGAGLVPDRVSGHQDGITTTGGHKTLPYDVRAVDSAFLLQ